MTIQCWRSCRSEPAPAHRVPAWPPVSTEHGPYLRIDRQPRVRDNFLDEYHIAVKEASEAGSTAVASVGLASFALALATSLTARWLT